MWSHIPLVSSDLKSIHDEKGLGSISLFSRNQWSTHAIQGMKFHNPPVGSGLGPRQERLVWAHGTIHPSEPSSPGWTIGDGSMGHHDQTINVWWTGVMAQATNLTALVAWTAHTCQHICTVLQSDCTTAPAAWTSHATQAFTFKIYNVCCS